MKIILTGGTGFIGRPLVNQLVAKGYSVVLLTRNPSGIKETKGAVEAHYWDGRSNGPWAAALEGADAVINLAGEPIAAKRWTLKQKERIISSRVDAAYAIVNAIRSCEHKPKVLINASAVGYYGNVDDGDIDESHDRGKGFLAQTCDLWEQAAAQAESMGIRTVYLRIGVVLERGGGAIEKMILPFRLFAGGPLGSGKQWFPWIHRDDMIGIVLYSLENTSVRGPVNATAPGPVTMKGFCSALGKVMRRPSWAPVPGFILRLMLGEMSEMLLDGQKVIPEKITKAGYQFKYPDIRSALKVIFKG
ncbi:MAG: TIGR01777 family protein [Candidatus Omnitrophica bacterium]|nr:TIGR01777 family protein [Candidatus Omnitrophota bacterium]